MEHLSLEIFDLATAEDKNPTTSKYAMLPEDASITITDTSEIFASGDVWSHSFSLNVQANAHIFGSAGDMHGSRLHDQLDKRKARLWVEGLPLYLGYLRLGDEAEVDEDGNVDVTFESGQKTFDDLIEGAKANQVPMMSDILIGVALWRKRKVSFGVKMKAGLTYKDGKTSADSGDVKIEGSEDDYNIMFEADGENENTPTQDYPAMVFPKGIFLNADTKSTEPVNCLNTDTPYDEGHPYCNVALCYQRSGYERKMSNGNVEPDYSQEPEAQRGYEVMPANRVNSAPNFYVIYWLLALMKHLNIHVDENQMMAVEDLRRLFFVNTKCAYREQKHVRSTKPKGINRYRFSGSRLVPEYLQGKVEIESVNFEEEVVFEGYEKLVNKEECGFTATLKSIDTGSVENVKNVNVTVSEVVGWVESDKSKYFEENSYLHDAIATSDCFPDVDISEVISALENGFGIRLLFDGNYQRVRIVLLRNIFRSSDVQTVSCDIISDGKVENNIRGFRMTYGNTEDSHFYYKGFADKLPHMKTLWPDDSDKHDYSQWKLDASYASLLNKVSAFNKICYVTPETGNAYGVKVDKDAKRYEELHPSLFEYAGFMDAEDGDCTGEEETIETIEMGFTPAIMNDVNFENERNGADRQRFALFVDETMRPRRPDLGDLSAPNSYNDSDAYYDISEMYKKYGPNGSDSNMTHDDGIVAPGEFAVTSDMYAKKTGLEAEVHIPVGAFPAPYVSVRFTFDIEGHINEGYRMYLQDNFEPNDDGVSPIEKHEWGLTLGIMRGSGSDAGVIYESDPDDLEGNDTWHIEPGSSTVAHPDTCDSYGRLFDYTADGQEDEQSAEGRFSLKLRAEKPNPYYDPNKPEGSTVVRTKAEAGTAMTRLFTSANTNLLTRPKVSNATMRAAGWSAPGDGYATVYSMGYGVQYSDGKVHEILWTPIKADGSVLTQSQLQEYIETFNNLSSSAIKSHDTQHLILDIDTTEQRAELLHELQAIYYAQDGETVEPVVLPGSNTKYLTISNEKLRHRGLCDQFYTEYSYWVRNARIAKRTVRMELAEFLAIDKTKKVTVGDVTGFIRKTQFTVSNKTGLGMVTMEIMYI